MRKALSVLPLLIGVSSIALAAETKPASRHQYMRDFQYTSCGEQYCVQLSAKGAHMSFFGGAFSTEGATTLKILKTDGTLVSEHFGIEATFNPKLKLITLFENENDVLFYSLKDEKLSAFKQEAPGVGK